MAVSTMVTLQGMAMSTVVTLQHKKGVAVLRMVTLQGSGNGNVNYGYITG